MKKREKKVFQRALKKAETILKDSVKLGDLMDKAKRKLDSETKRASKIKDDLLGMIRMIKAYFSGDYKEVPLKTILWLIGSLIYFVWPLDAIPDFIFSLGFLDDLSVITFVIASLKKDIDRFLEWEESKAITEE